MVMDGVLIIESIDIIDEIDRFGSHGGLRPRDIHAIDEMDGLMKRANDAHTALKLLTFEFLFSAAPLPPQKLLRRFKKLIEMNISKSFIKTLPKVFRKSAYLMLRVLAITILNILRTN